MHYRAARPDLCQVPVTLSATAKFCPERPHPSPWFPSSRHYLPDSDTGHLRSRGHSEAVTMDITRMTGTVRRPAYFMARTLGTVAKAG